MYVFIRASMLSNVCNRFHFGGVGVDECALWLSFAQQTCNNLKHFLQDADQSAGFRYPAHPVNSDLGQPGMDVMMFFFSDFFTRCRFIFSQALGRFKRRQFFRL
jgi:hypothetical protein